MVSNKIAKYIYVFAILFTVGALIYFPKWIVDDAYITFRYSENLANHFNLTYNIDSHPVEGYTGVVLPVLIAIAIKIGIPPVFATHAIGVISYIIGGIFLIGILKKIHIGEIACSVTLLLYSITPVMYTHIFSGLETILFTATGIMIFYISISLLQKKIVKTNYFTFFNLLLLLFSLIRPEGILLYSLISIFLIFYYYNENKILLRRFIRNSLIIFVIPFIIYFLWRWNYYGQFFPNTYYLKSGNFIFSDQSFNSFIAFFTKYLSLPFIISFVVLLLNVDRIWKEIKNNENKVLSKEFLFILLPTLIFSGILLVQYFHSDLLMDFSHRFYIPIFPVLLLLFAIILNTGFENMKDLARTNPITSKAYLVIITFFFIFHFNSIISDFRKEVIINSKMKVLLEDVHLKAGKFIQQNFDNKKTLLVHADAGAIPFFSKLKTIDFGGLNDTFLSHKNELTDKQIIDYFFQVNADVLAIASFNRDKIERKESSLNWNTLKYTLEDERFQNYTLVKVFSTSVWKYYMYILVKKELQINLVKEMPIVRQ